MQDLITFPACRLFAAELITAKSDVRYYLNGVYLTNKHVVATDGHRMLVIPHAEETEIPFNIIIPNDAIATLRKQLTAKERKEKEITLYCLEEGDRYELSCAGRLSIFVPVVGTFPKWERIVPDPKQKPDYHGTFHWPYMTDFSKANALLGASKDNNRVRLISHGFASAEVKLSACPEATGVIMPVRE